MKLTVIVILLAGAAAWRPAADRPAPSVQRFRAVFEYDYATMTGTITRRERVAGTYTRDFGANRSTWSDVSEATSAGRDAFGPSTPLTALSGFSYALQPGAAMTSPEFFSAVPTAGIQERNLVWDTQMFATFGEDQWAHLQPNVPYHFMPHQAIPLAGAGTFTNEDVQLTLVGTTTRDGADAAVIEYHAFFNPVQLTASGTTFHGRSHYWGQVWVARATRRLIGATLFEDVLGEAGLPSGPAAPVNVFRIGTMEGMRDQ